MKHEVTRRGRHALLVLLIGCLLGVFVGAGPVMAQDANPLRALPAAVAPGDEFEVIVTFTSPADGFNSVGLEDVAPAGWTVGVHRTWCTPEADVAWIEQADVAQYIWYGPPPAGTGYAEGEQFTATYKVQVPPGAAFDTYTFPGGTLQYYIAGAGPYVQTIGGAFQIEVALYDLTIDSTEGGHVDTPGEGTFEGYEPGEVVALMAVAHECYEFVNWTGPVADPNSPDTTITMDGNYSITANFAKIQYELTISSTEGGSVTTPGEGAFTRDCGQTVDLVAVAHECYEFTGWTGPVADPSSANTTITMDDDYSITANFALIQYELTIGSTDGGSVTTPGEGAFTRDCGETVDLVAVADECYEFTGWTGPVADPNSPETTITMDDDYTITANFVLLQFDLTIDSTEGGSVTAPGEDTFTYDCGDIVDLVAVADEGYLFDKWTGDTDGIADPGSATTTVTMTDDYSITAEFVAFDAVIEGQVRAVNCDVLSGVTVSLYSNDTLIATAVSAGDGSYMIAVPALGDYTVVASLLGFRDHEKHAAVTESATYTIDFVADHGLIPNAPDTSYVLKCINLWQYGAPPCELTMTRVLAVINAWQFPIHVI